MNRVVREDLAEKVTLEQRGKDGGESCAHVQGKSSQGSGNCSAKT